MVKVNLSDRSIVVVVIDVGKISALSFIATTGLNIDVEVDTYKKFSQLIMYTL